jgi:hypothetical protein
MGEWRYSSTILDLGTSWRRVVSFTPRPFDPEESARGTLWIGGWASEPVSTLWRKENVTVPGIETGPSSP